MPFFDISRPLQANTAVWPGDTPFSLTEKLSRRDGHSVNLTTLTTSVHVGTHVDAPHHFADGVPTIDALDLSIYWGPAQVVTVKKKHGPLYPADFAGYNPAEAKRLLVRSAAPVDFTRFDDFFVYPTPELADFLGQWGIILYGCDTYSMDAMEEVNLPGHNALLKNNIAILEGLDLTGVPDGVYELCALPLKIVGGDGSPVRAVLRF